MNVDSKGGDVRMVMRNGKHFVSRHGGDIQNQDFVFFW